MEWFKHSTGSHEDPDISDAWDQFGDAGPVIFWTILEVFGAEYSHLKDGWLTLSIPYFERKTRRKFRKTEKILEYFEKRERIYFEITQETISFTIPKFIKIASNWTTRPKQIPTVLPTDAPTELPTAKEEEKKKNKNNTPLTPRKRGDDYETEFLDFWNAYPKKAKKPNAYREWKKLGSKRPGTDHLVGCIVRQKKWRTWAEGFIPDPERWLKGERWNDEEPPQTGGSNGNRSNTYRRYSGADRRDTELPADVQAIIDEINARSTTKAAASPADGEE